MALVSQVSDDQIQPNQIPDNRFNEELYSVKDYCYPSDLLGRDSYGNNIYGNNHVIFYINVPIESKLLKDGSVQTVENYTPRQRGIAGGGEYTAATATAGSLIGGFGLSKVVGALGGSGAGGAVGVVSGAGVAGIALEAGTFSRQVKRLKTAIALYVPNQLSIRYSVNYSDEDTAAFNAIARLGEETAKLVGEAAGKVTETFKGNLNAPPPDVSGTWSTMKSVAAAVGYSTAFGNDALSAATGTAVNPKKEQIFKGVDFRSFTLDYQFFPRDPKEARNVLNIIEEFKYHMHPEYKDAANFLFLYPSEFDVVYYNNDKENSSIHKHTSSVLVDMAINYTPNGVFTTFEDGMPTQINIVLTFRELAVMTKERIKEGY